MFAPNPEKKTQKEAQKDMNEMEWHKMDYLIFSAMRLRKRHLFCTSTNNNKQTNNFIHSCTYMYMYMYK